jgi:hypothetical protein
MTGKFIDSPPAGLVQHRRNDPEPVSEFADADGSIFPERTSEAAFVDQTRGGNRWPIVLRQVHQTAKPDRPCPGEVAVL